MATTAAVEVQIGTGAAVSSMGELRKQLKEANLDVLNMSTKFGETSKQAIEAAKRAAELKDRIGDAKQLTDAFSPDKKFQAFSGALQGVVGGFSAVQGALAAFGVQSSEVEKTLVKVQGAMALSQGLNSVLSSIDAFKNLGAVIKASTAFQTVYNAATVTAAAVTRAFGASVQTTSVGFKALRAAIISTGIGALVVGLGFVVDKVMSWTNATSNNKEEQEKLNKALKEQNAINQQNLKNIEFTTKANLLRAQIAGKSADELFNIQKQGAQMQEAELNRTLTNQRKQIADYVAQQGDNLDKSSEYWKNLLNSVGETKTKLADLNDKIRLDDLQNQVRIADDRRANEKKSAEEAKQNAEKAAQDRKQKADQAKQKRDAEQKAIEDATKQSLENIRKIEEENYLASIANEDKRAKAKLQIDYENAVKEINQSKATAEVKNKELSALDEKFRLENEALDAAAKEKKQKMLEEESQKSLDAMVEQLNKEAEEQEKIRQLNIERDKAEIETRTNLRNAYFEATGALINILKDFAGKNKGLQRAALIAENALTIARIILDTQKANAAVGAKYALLPGGGILAAREIIANKIRAGIGIATAVAATAKGLQGIGGSGGGSAGGGSVGGATGGTPAPIPVEGATTTLNPNQINQLATATNRAFVLESDVSGNQERIRRLNRAARIN